MLTQKKPFSLPRVAQVHLFHSPPSPGSSSFSSAELRLLMSLVKKLVFSMPDCGDGYKLLVQLLSSKFWAFTETTTKSSDVLVFIYLFFYLVEVEMEGGNLVEFLIQVYTAKKKKVGEWCQNLFLCVGLCNRVLPNCQPCALAYVCIVAFDCQKQEWPTHPELWVWLSQKRKKQKNVKVFKPKIKNWVVFFFLTSLSVERSRCVPKPRASGCYRRVNRATRGIDWEQLSGTHTGNILNTFLSNKMSWNSSEEQKKTDFNAWGYRPPSCSNGELQ